MDQISELLDRGVDKIYPFRDTLEKVLRSGKKLKVYQGFDPSGIQLHIGHLTGLMKLRQFQNLGHHVIFLIGDGTGQAGDPSGKSRARGKYLTRDQLRANAKDYVMQAHKIVRFKGENAAEILYNSDWLNKLTLVDILKIEDHFSLQQLEERDIFEKRKKEGQEIPLREFMYPLLQGYDSVAMNVDLELGGSDQTFNMLAGRKLVREMLGKEKYVMTTPLLTDSTGKKIGKTEGNVIALNAPPSEFYGMIMSLPDDVIVNCFEYITDLAMTEIKEIETRIMGGENPMLFKKRLAFTLTRMLNDEEKAKQAQDNFEKIFQKRQIPDKLETIKLSKDRLNIIDLIVESKIVSSRSDAKRLVEQGAVELDGQKTSDVTSEIQIKNGIILKVGKRRFARLDARR